MSNDVLDSNAGCGPENSIKLLVDMINSAVPKREFEGKNQFVSRID